jgi:hypothetical protein
MSISTQAMTATGENFSHCKTATDPNSAGPMPVIKRNIYTPEEARELRDILRDLLDPL